MPQSVQVMPYIRFELIQDTLCFTTYVLFEAVHRIRPHLFNLWQYLQFRGLQGLIFPVEVVGSGSRLAGSLARTSVFLRFFGLRKAMTSFCWWINLVEQDLPKISSSWSQLSAGLGSLGCRLRPSCLHVDLLHLSRWGLGV